MPIAFLFPGQGSQSVGMLDALLTQSEVAREVLAEASEALGEDLVALISAGPEARLNQTEWTQPALLASSVALWRTWTEHTDIIPDLMAGHSLGEYSALVCSGAMSFADAITLVHNRGLYMQDAVSTGEGAMAAVLGLDSDVLQQVCDRAAQGQVVSQANLNADGQIVIAGHTAAVARAGELATEAGARKVIPLAVSVPSHCQLMKPAADRLADDLAAIDLNTPRIDVLHNVDVSLAQSADDIRDRLIRQLYQPVRWHETLTRMTTSGTAVFAECGPGKVLWALARRHDRTAQHHALIDQQAIESAIAALTQGVSS